MTNALIIFFGSILSIFVRGWVLLCGYGWFLVPMGAPVITFWHILGLSVFIHFVMFDMTVTRSEKRNSELVVVSIITSLVSLLFLYVFKLLAF